MAFLRGFAGVFAFVACVGAANLCAAAKAEPVEKGRRYLSSQKNLRLHIIWTCIGVGVGVLFLR